MIYIYIHSFLIQAKHIYEVVWIYFLLKYIEYIELLAQTLAHPPNIASRSFCPFYETVQADDVSKHSDGRAITMPWFLYVILLWNTL